MFIGRCLFIKFVEEGLQSKTDSQPVLLHTTCPANVLFVGPEILHELCYGICLMLWNRNSVKNRQHENSLPVELAQPKANVRSFLYRKPARKLHPIYQNMQSA